MTGYLYAAPMDMPSIFEEQNKTTIVTLTPTPTPTQETPMGNLEVVLDLFNDPDIPWNYILRELSTAFGPDATIHSIAKYYASINLPSKEIDGKNYIAGYRGPNMVRTGLHTAKLLDIKQSGNNAKLMFSVYNNRYLFQTLEKFRIEDIVRYTKQIGKSFSITVLHEEVPNTGDLHAVIIKSECCE